MVFSVIKKFYFLITIVPLFLKSVIGIFGTVIILILYPLVLIRIGFFQSSRIGHYVTETQLAILQNDKIKQSKKRLVFDIWFEYKVISNTFIQSYWRGQLRVWNRQIMAPIYTVMKRIKMPRRFFIEAHSRDRDLTDSLRLVQPPTLFTSFQIKEFREVLSRIGLPENAKYICFHHRDSAYLKNAFPGEDYSYHSYRDSSLKNYIPGLEKLTERGYYVVRMGNVTAEKLPSKSSSRIIDYANSDLQSDILDVFLVSECEYFISSSSGIDSVATLLKKPILFLNVSNFSYIATWQANVMYSFKHFIDYRKNVELKVNEIFSRHLNSLLRTQGYTLSDIILQENSADENVLYIIEFDDYFRADKFLVADDLTNLEKQFWKIFPFNLELHPPNVQRCRISQLYLQKNFSVVKS